MWLCGRLKKSLYRIRFSYLSLALPWLLVLVPATLSSPLRASSPGKGPGNLSYTIAVRERIARGPVNWVAEGNGVLIYGAGSKLFTRVLGGEDSKVTSLTLPEPVTGGVVMSRYAYLCQPGAGLRVVDLSIPEDPADMGVFPLEGGGHYAALWGDYLLVASGADGLRVFDLSAVHHCGTMVYTEDRRPHGDPFNLSMIGFLRISEDVTGLAAVDRGAVVSLSGGELLTVDLTHPDHPSASARLSGVAPSKGLSAAGSVIAQALGDGGVRILDIAGGHATAQGAIGLRAESVLLEGRGLYVASGPGGLYRAETGPLSAITVTINVGNFFFSPSSVSIQVGDTVKWQWVGGTHTTTSGTCAHGDCTPDGNWESPVKTSGNYSRVFDSAGTFPYYCGIHLSAMTGTVTVEGSAPLAASSSADVTTGSAPLQVTFTGSASGGTPPYTYAWDFGDGESSTLQSPVHTFAAPGSYSVAFGVVDGSSGAAQADPLTITATLPAALSASASANPLSGIAPLTVSFTGSASGGNPPYTYTWSFGDGGLSGSQNPVHVYSSPGAYTAVLQVVDSATGGASSPPVSITVTSVAPPHPASMVKAGNPFRIKVFGSNLQSGIEVYIDGQLWNLVKWKNAGKIVLKGGRSLKNIVPRGVETQFTFVNPDGGQATESFTW